MTLLLGLDIGTTSLKAVLYDTDLGQVTRVATRPTPTSHPQPGWSEHDSQSLWDSLCDCIKDLTTEAKPAALAISSMAEAGLLVDAQGQALSPIIAWYDRRSEPQAAWIEQQISIADLYRLTGQRVSPSFGVTKLLWLHENQPQAFAQAARWLPVPTYLLFRLCGEQAVDYSIASRTLLFDQTQLNWSARLLDTFGLSADLLPPAYPGGSAVGRVTAQAAAETGLPEGAVCALGGHDHLCAALAVGAHAPGAVTDSSGSANALLMLTSGFIPDPQLAERGYASYAYVLKDRFSLKGGLKAAGSAIDWLARQLSPSAEPDYAALEASAAEGVALRAGPLWLPHWIGSGTPEGDRYSRAGLVGVQFEHTAGDLFRALLEALALWTRHNIEEMAALTGPESHPGPIPALTVIGGVTRLSLLTQLKADALNRPVLVPHLPEAAATGAALLAGLGAGVFASPEQALGSLRGEITRVEPIPAHVSWYDQLYQHVYRPLYTTLKPLNQALDRLEQQAAQAQKTAQAQEGKP